MSDPTPGTHSFHALAFAENFDLKKISNRLEVTRLSSHELRVACGAPIGLAGGVLTADRLTPELRGAQEAAELILDVARDRRLVILEVTIVGLIVLEVILGLL